MAVRGQGEKRLGAGPRRSSPWRRRALLIAVLAAGAIAAPHVAARRLPGPGSAPADAVLVLTGGENRIRAGFEAWREGKGKNLHILGAFRESSLGRILPESAALPPEALSRVHIEGWSENTIENAISAKSIVRARRYAAVVLVTSDYHMARAHLAVRSVLPEEVALAVIPVSADWGTREAWLRVPRLYVVEGLKYWVYRAALLWE